LGNARSTPPEDQHSWAQEADKGAKEVGNGMSGAQAQNVHGPRPANDVGSTPDIFLVQLSGCLEHTADLVVCQFLNAATTVGSLPVDEVLRACAVVGALLGDVLAEDLL